MKNLNLSIVLGNKLNNKSSSNFVRRAEPNVDIAFSVCRNITINY
jgi:hypothetical protein